VAYFYIILDMNVFISYILKDCRHFCTTNAMQPKVPERWKDKNLIASKEMQREYHFDHKNQLQFSRIHQSPKCQESFSTNKRIAKKKEEKIPPWQKRSLSKSTFSNTFGIVTYTGLTSWVRRNLNFD